MRYVVSTAVVLLAAGWPSTATGGTTLAAGTFRLPAANAFGEPGFHEVITITGRVPAGLRSAKGARLVLELRDAGRPKQTCSSEHPLSGCATVDWSDREDRPKVPPGGVFENSITVGKVKLFLRESGALASRPDSFQPG